RTTCGYCDSTRLANSSACSCDNRASRLSTSGSTASGPSSSSDGWADAGIGRMRTSEPIASVNFGAISPPKPTNPIRIIRIGPFVLSLRDFRLHQLVPAKARCHKTQRHVRPLERLKGSQPVSRTGSLLVVGSSRYHHLLGLWLRRLEHGLR